MADPLSKPAVKEIIAEVGPAVMPVMVGAAGSATGFTCLAPDSIPPPNAFTARILMEYVVPFNRPDTINGLAVDPKLRVVHSDHVISPSDEYLYWYVVMLEPLSKPAVKAMVAPRSPVVISPVIVGAAGLSTGITGDDWVDSAPAPIMLTALILNT